MNDNDDENETTYPRTPLALAVEDGVRRAMRALEPRIVVSILNALSPRIQELEARAENHEQRLRRIEDVIARSRADTDPAPPL